jgi:hypothetical protein
MSDTVEFKQNEYHQMTIYKTMSVGNEWIEEQGLTVDRFKEILLYQGGGFGSPELYGEEPIDEEMDIFMEIVWGADCIDSEEDLWTDRKGGYDIDYELIEDEE